MARIYCVYLNRTPLLTISTTFVYFAPKLGVKSERTRETTSLSLTHFLLSWKRDMIRKSKGKSKPKHIHHLNGDGESISSVSDSQYVGRRLHESLNCVKNTKVRWKLNPSTLKVIMMLSLLESWISKHAYDTAAGLGEIPHQFLKHLPATVLQCSLLSTIYDNLVLSLSRGGGGGGCSVFSV